MPKNNRFRFNKPQLVDAQPSYKSPEIEVNAHLLASAPSVSIRVKNAPSPEIRRLAAPYLGMSESEAGDLTRISLEDASDGGNQHVVGSGEPWTAVKSSMIAKSVNVEDRLSRIETALAESAKKETHQAVVIENLKSSIKDLTSDVAYLTNKAILDRSHVIMVAIIKFVNRRLNGKKEKEINSAPVNPHSSVKDLLDTINTKANQLAGDPDLKFITKDHAACLTKSIKGWKRNTLCHPEHQSAAILSEAFALQRVVEKGKTEITPAQATFGLRFVLAVLEKGEARRCIQVWRDAGPGVFTTAPVQSQLTAFEQYFR